MKTKFIPAWAKLILSALLFFGISTPASAKPWISYRYLTSTPDGWVIQYTYRYPPYDFDKAYNCTNFASMPNIGNCMMTVTIQTVTNQLVTTYMMTGADYDFSSNNALIPTFYQLEPAFVKGGTPFPWTFNVSVPFSKGAPKCVYLLMGRQLDPRGLSGRINDCSESTVPVPPPPPEPVKCEFSAVGDSTIDHGPLADTALNGAQASTQINIRCTNTDNNPTTLIVESIGGDSRGINLRPGPNNLYTKITVDGKEAYGGTTVKVDRANFNIDVRSNLITYGTTLPAPGALSGSAVIKISPP